MGAWPDIGSAILDLRRFVNDGPEDRPIKKKQVIGRVDGVNRDFVTWDDRIIPTSLVVTVDDVPIAPSQLQVTDAVLGQFTLTIAPPAQSTVRAQYFYQYFFDDELKTAMEMASNEINETDDITSIPLGLKLVAIHFGGHFAYQKQSIRWAQRMSSRFILEEEPLDAETMTRSNQFREIARDLRDAAERLRENYYKRHGRREAPAFNVYKPRIPPIGPRR